jgi:hypothetical protein
VTHMAWHGYNKIDPAFVFILTFSPTATTCTVLMARELLGDCAAALDASHLLAMLSQNS